MLVIGIAGPSAAGKSTFAQLLRDSLPGRSVAVVSGDLFYRHTFPQIISPFSGKTYDDYNCPDALDMDAFAAAVTEAAQENDIVIAEGLFVLATPEFRRLCDLKIYVDLDSDHCLMRRVRRNMAAGMEMNEIADFYLESAKYSLEKFVRPTRVYADLILNGNNLEGNALQAVLGFLERREKGIPQ